MNNLPQIIQDNYQIELIHQNPEYNIDIYKCKANDNSHQLLITNGMSVYEQNVNEANADLQHIELYMWLPEYLNLENNNWPIHWLNRIAQLPQKNNTWFGDGDTIPAGNPPQEIDERLATNHFIVSRPKHLHEIYQDADLSAKGYKLLAVFPLFQDEVNYKLKNSHTLLYKKLKKNNLDERIDIFRQSVMQRKMFKLF
ncbi:suppressor of fused domain protein [Paracrocinitomix mangrovi]|uniref:suppressor of fused domain protein n=1 Tax=Paracrocinitomix mangrovi TaxID=2862509 RepID=UPI001C8E8664|nr:suppressor of fused domain protein [Paracrocinitomix mangrovi]UKN00497.1 suppressor of fused domain protein [Paracrocinitomix mangrovi]